MRAILLARKSESAGSQDIREMLGAVGEVGDVKLYVAGLSLDRARVRWMGQHRVAYLRKGMFASKAGVCCTSVGMPSVSDEEDMLLYPESLELPVRIESPLCVAEGGAGRM